MAAAALVLSILALLSDLISCQRFTLFGCVGESITLSPARNVNLTEILWKKGQHKLIEVHGSREVFISPSFKERIHVDIESGDLVIFNLTSSDEDEYEMESGNLAHNPTFDLKVLDSLPSPTLHCNWVNESIAVHCAVPQSYSRHRTLLGYAWLCSSQQCEGNSSHLAPDPPPELHFTKDDDLSQEVRCFVQNPKSNRTSLLLLSTCVPADKPRHRYLLIATLIVGIAFLIGFLYCARRTERATAR